jgi:flagellar basal-body rod protein FlgB
VPIKIDAENTALNFQRRLFAPAFNTLEDGIDYRAKRQSLISSNIANINTPNYRAFDLIMQDQMSNDSDHDLNENLQSPKLVPTPTPVKNDGNSVDLDLEMSKLTENQLMFTTLTTTLSKRFEQLRSVIAEGRK